MFDRYFAAIVAYAGVWRMWHAEKLVFPTTELSITTERHA